MNEQGSSTPDDAAQDLKATSDSILEDLRQLASVEDQKQQLEAADPATDRLSAEAVELAGRIERETRAEQQLAREIR